MILEDFCYDLFFQKKSFNFFKFFFNLIKLVKDNNLTYLKLKFI